MKTRGLIAGAFALALGLSASAEAWFDAKISDYTEWPNEVAEGGAWSNTDGATLNTESPAKLVVDAEDDAALTFAATQSKAIGDGVTINSTVTFNAFDSLPTVPADAKAALIAVKDGDDNYNIYGLAYSSSKAANDWVEVLADQSNITDVPVSINLLWNGEQTEVTYTINGASTEDLTVYTAGNANIAGAAFSGCGEVAALAATYVVPKATINPYNGDHADYLYIKSVVDASGTEYWDSEAGNAKVPVGTEVKIYFAIDTTNVKKVIVGTDYITLTPAEAVEIDIGDTEIGDIDIQDAKAAIGTTYYVTFNAAIDAAAETQDPVTITLLDNFEIGADDDIVVPANATVEIEAGQAWKVTLTEADSEFWYAVDEADFVQISQGLTAAGKILKYGDNHYFVGVEGTVFTITFVEGVESIKVTADSEDLVTLYESGTIQVDPNLSSLAFEVTAVSTIDEPVYAARLNDATDLEPSENIFELQDGFDTESTIAFTVTEGKLEGVTFLLTATGIVGTPTYTLAGEANPNDFQSYGKEGIWMATVPQNAVFTVNYTKDSAITMPVVTWTTELSRTGDQITMGESDGAATLDITDAKDVDPTDPTAQEAAKQAIVDSVTVPAQGMDLEQTKAAVAAQVKVLTDGGALPSAIAGWIETKGFTGAQVATAKAIDVSYDFGTGLFQTEAKAEVTAFAADAEVANTYAFEVALKDGTTPVQATQAAQAAVEKIVQASSDVADFTTEAKKLTPTISDVAVSEGKLTFKVGLPDGAAKAFMRIAK